MMELELNPHGRNRCRVKRREKNRKKSHAKRRKEERNVPKGMTNITEPKTKTNY